MISLGKKHESCAIMPEKTSSKAKMYYPSFHISDIDLGIGEDDVGKELTATVKIKISSAGKRINTDSKGTTKTEEYSIDVLGMEIKGAKGNVPTGEWRVQDIMKHRRSK
jgi:hypothetical protein